MTRAFLAANLAFLLITPCIAVADEVDDEQSYRQYIEQQEGEAKAQEVHDIIVPIVRDLFTHNRKHNVIIYNSPYGYGPYGYPYPHNIHNVPVTNQGTGKPNQCYQQINGGPFRPIPCY